MSTGPSITLVGPLDESRCSKAVSRECLRWVYSVEKLFFLTATISPTDADGAVVTENIRQVL
ncbi:MAG: hypothetical protein WAU56_10395 [Steroidobacteraceae bacterium]